MRTSPLYFDHQKLRLKKKKRLSTFLILGLCLMMLCLHAVSVGGLAVSYQTLFKGLFISYNPDVALVYDLRFPRIAITLLAGAAISVSGLLFQSVLKNDLADPAIIGVCSGANVMVLLSGTLFPQFLLYGPILSFFGGCLSFLMIYLLSWKRGLHPVRLILTGIAINALFAGLSNAISAFAAGINTPYVNALISGNISQKTWSDLDLLLPYTLVGLSLAFLLSRCCDLVLLDDKIIKNLGIDGPFLRLMLSLVAVLLASAATSIVGMVSFLGLIVPHIGRLLIGNKHCFLIPFSAIFGAFLFLLADTLGRSLFYPLEINPSIVMNILGAPYFIYLLRKAKLI